MKTYIIGDIHGGLLALQQVLARAPIDLTKDRIIFLGDYVDGWSHSAEVIDYLIDLQETFTQELIFLKGNHDVWCSDYLHKGRIDKIWEQNGGKTTIESYIKTGYLVDNDHRLFFRNLRDYYIDEENNAFVHGGFVSRKGLGHDPYTSNYYWDRDMWSLALLAQGRTKEDIPSIYRFFQHNEVFIGHTATTNWKCKIHYPEADDINQIQNGEITVPMNRCNVWNLDTGAGWNGKLTIMDIHSKEYWQSDRLTELYKDEKGRI